MTKKEAIDTLKLMQAQVEWEYPMDYSVAIDMAVAVLAEEPEQRSFSCSQENDTISRQAAIDQVKFECGELNGLAERIENRINKLPSAEPERKTGKWILVDDQDPEDTRNGNYRFICSNCLHSDIHVKTIEVPFCWNCGADMMEETGGAK